MRYDLHDLQIGIPEPSVRPSGATGLLEGLNTNGNVSIPLGDDWVRRVIRTLRADGVMSFVVCLLHHVQNENMVVKPGGIEEQFEGPDPVAQ
jgi:N-methylhydantoinase A/oxoprolinase/acetone carboxylase beta subunit